MEVHEDFESGFERDESNHDPFEAHAVPMLFLLGLRPFGFFERIEPRVVMVDPIAKKLEPSFRDFVIHDS